MPLQEVHTGFTFGFDGSRLSAIERGVKRASKSMGNVAQRTAALQTQMGSLLQRAKGVIGAYVGFRAVKTITTDYAEAADAIAKFSSGLGVSAREYQGLTHAAKLNGLTIEELNVALPNLAKRAGDAADGSKAAATAFRRAGVELKEGGKLKDPIRLLAEMADGMKGIKDEGRRTQILMTLFGRAGKRMGVLLDQGSAGIKKAMLAAQKLGIVLGDKDLKAAEKFKDEMLRVKSILIGVRNTVAARVVPALTRVLTRFKEWWLEGKNAERALRVLKLTAILAGLVISRMIGAAVIKQLAIFVRDIVAATLAIKRMGIAAGVTALKVAAIFAAIALVVLLIEDLIGFAQGKDSLIGRLLGDSSLAKQLRAALNAVWKEIKQAWKEIKPALREAWEALKPALREVGRLLKPLIGPAFKAAIMVLIGMLYGLVFTIEQVSAAVRIMKAAFTAAAAAIGFIADWLTEKWEDFTDDVSDAFDEAAAAAKQLARLFGIDLTKSAAWVKTAWDGATAGIRKTLRTLMDAARTAKNAMDTLTGKDVKSTAKGFFGAITGRQRVEGTLGGAIENIERDLASGAISLAPLAGPPAAAPGLFAPPQQIISVGAINNRVDVQGADPKLVVEEVEQRMGKRLAKTFTDASRDLKPPPRGQR
jgi:hypothetical protein